MGFLLGKLFDAFSCKECHKRPLLLPFLDHLRRRQTSVDGDLAGRAGRAGRPRRGRGAAGRGHAGAHVPQLVAGRG